MAFSWNQAGVFLYELDANEAYMNDILDWSTENHFGWCALQCFNGSTLIQQERIGEWRNAIWARGMNFGLWGVQHTDPSGDASRADSQIDLWGAEFYIADAEADYKTDTGGERGRAATFCTAFRAAQPTIPAALTTYGAIANETGLLGDVTDANAGVMDFKAWYDAGFHALPQAYASDWTYEPGRVIRHYRRCKWPFDRIHPIAGIYNGGSTYRGDDYRDYFNNLNNTEWETDVRADSPAAFWKMQESSGNPVDMSPNGYNIESVTGTPDYQQAGPLDGSYAIRMTGGEYLTRTSPVSSLQDNFTLEIWAKIEQIGQNQQILLHNGTYTTNGWGIVVDMDRTFRYIAGNVAYGANSANQITLDTWAYIVVVRDGGTWKYYLNGDLDTNNAGTHTPNIPTGAVRIGDGSVQWQVAYAAIYPSVLGAVGVAERYDLRIGQPNCSPRTAFGISLFLGEVTGDYGVAIEQDYIDLGLSITADQAAAWPNSVVVRPDADIATTGWTTTPLYSKINDDSDATVITATAT